MCLLPDGPEGSDEAKGHDGTGGGHDYDKLLSSIATEASPFMIAQRLSSLLLLQDFENIDSSMIISSRTGISSRLKRLELLGVFCKVHLR